MDENVGKDILVYVKTIKQKISMRKLDQVILLLT